MAYATSEVRRSANAAGSASPGARRPKSGRSASLPAGIPERRGRGSFLAGLGIGLAVGAAVAILLAPQSGADTRRSLRRRGRRMKSRASDAWEDLRTELARTKRALRRRRREVAPADREPDDA
jgi:hypothetical protein